MVRGFLCRLTFIAMTVVGLGVAGSIDAHADIVPPNSPAHSTAATSSTVTAVHNCGVDPRIGKYRCYGGTWTFSGFPTGTQAMVTSGGATRYGAASGSMGVGACPRTNLYCSVGVGYSIVYCSSGTNLGPFYDDAPDNVAKTYYTGCPTTTATLASATAPSITRLDTHDLQLAGLTPAYAYTVKVAASSTAYAFYSVYTDASGSARVDYRSQCIPWRNKYGTGLTCPAPVDVTVYDAQTVIVRASV